MVYTSITVDAGRPRRPMGSIFFRRGSHDKGDKNEKKHKYEHHKEDSDGNDEEEVDQYLIVAYLHVGEDLMQQPKF
ncbi:hypothetical protein PG985_001973 [Apiospora marii]|uniref:uncharacterized protein n=1 Tax=Apiospora marii TaxID=335849 RepID=UPI00312D3BFF